MDTEELQRKHPNKKKTVADLALFLKTRSEGQPNFSLLLGAGASITSGVRSGKELVEDWREELYAAYAGCKDTYTPEVAIRWFSENHDDWYDESREYSSFFERKFDLPAQRRIFIEQEVKDSKPSLGYAYLAELVNDSYVNTVFTTNFDDLLNEAFYLFGDQRPLVCAHDSSIKGVLVTAKRPKIIKLHGDYLFDDLKCTIDQTSKLDENTQEKFEQFLREYGLIVMGYSGDDESIMNPLDGLLADDRFLRNGLYWCIKNGSKISPRLERLLNKEKAFYVLIDGFDESMAEMHRILRNQDLGLDGLGELPRLPDTVNHWLESRNLYNQDNQVIQNQLESLEKSRNRGLLGNALAELYAGDTSGEQLNELDDEESIKLMKVISLVRQNKYHEFIKAAYRLVDESSKSEFIEYLLRQTFHANKRVGDIKSAEKDCDRLEAINEEDPRYNLMRSTIVDSFDRKLEEIELAIKKDPDYWSAHDHKLSAYMEFMEMGIIERTTDAAEEITKAFKVSTSVRPSIANPSWDKAVTFLLDSAKGPFKESCISEVKQIINSMKRQGFYRPIVAEQICKLCFKTEERYLDFIGLDLFHYLREAALRNPTYNSKIFKLIVKSSIEFEEHNFADEMQTEYEKNKKNIVRNADYALALGEMYLEIFQDIHEAQRTIDAAIKYSNDRALVNRSITYNLYSENIETARNVFQKHKDLFGQVDQAEISSEISVREGDFSTAIKTLKTLRSLPNFCEKYASTLSFIHLKNEDYTKAKALAEKVLGKYGWSRESHSALIINYEYANLKLNQKVNKKRLSELLQAEGNTSVKAMANVLLSNHDEAIRIMIKEAKKRPSRIYQYETWPAAHSVMARLRRELNSNSAQLAIVPTAS